MSNRKPFNASIQYYKGIPVSCIGRFKHLRAKKFKINNTNQEVWIPNRHLEEDGTIISGQNIDYVFMQAWKRCAKAGIDLSCIKGGRNWNIDRLNTERSIVLDKV